MLKEEEAGDAMTPRAEVRPQMSVEEFEELERRAPETVWLEFIGGRLAVKRGPDGNRSEIIARLQRLWVGQAEQGGPWLYAYRG
jgi:Uma2 family endonuclease